MVLSKKSIKHNLYKHKGTHIDKINSNSSSTVEIFENIPCVMNFLREIVSLGYLHPIIFMQYLFIYLSKYFVVVVFRN